MSSSLARPGMAFPQGEEEEEEENVGMMLGGMWTPPECHLQAQVGGKHVPQGKAGAKAPCC